MLSGIAHEVRNPLGGIELFAGILRDELDSGDDRRGHVQRIEKELAYLKAVVSDFLEYARRPALERSTLDLAELCADVVELARADADAAHVPLRIDAEPTPCEVDSGQLRRAVLNLVRNAVQASAGVEGGEVCVTVRPQGQGAAISVINRGPPIPDEVREHMFEPFFTTREKGTGLGLAFVHEIITDHGGQVSMDSKDGDTTFRVVLG
jgi:signal transduction histidine kinase